MNTNIIDWSKNSWNPVSGCTKISTGCKHCYANRIALDLQEQGNPKYKSGFKTTCHSSLLREPLKWKKNKRVFVNSMSDLFHKDVADSFIMRVFWTMSLAAQHQFYILTKRSERLYSMRNELSWMDNIWMGVSVETADYLYRIDHLRATGAVIKFISIEPLLGPLPDMDLSDINWVIVGGESGPGARPMREEWVLDIRDQCIAAGVPFFFKQWSYVNGKKNGCLLKGETWNHMPKIKVPGQDFLMCV
ncbi:MAG: phage Gp37/Gp68 family protein [Desulfobacula sp.]|jgi:protein gp37|nr:phage Gp37/Gp68 family protein [Desulfobacula sp.]